LLDIEVETDEIIHDTIGKGDSWAGAAISGSIDAYAARMTFCAKPVEVISGIHRDRDAY